MFSKYAELMKTKGKQIEENTQAAGSGSSMYVHSGNVVSQFRLSTAPPFDVANKDINLWLDGTQTPSAMDSLSIRNEENVRVPSEPGFMAISESKQELNALATPLFNKQGPPGISVPTNTSESGDYNGLRVRARSVGDVNGMPLRMGPQSNTVNGDPPPLFSKSNFSVAPDVSIAIPQDQQISVHTEALNSPALELPTKSAERISVSYALPPIRGLVETSLSASPAMEVSTNPESSTTAATLASIAAKPLGTGQSVSKFTQDVPESATQHLVEHGTARVPSPSITQQHNEHLPIIPPPTPVLRAVVIKPESFQYSPTAPPFHDISRVGSHYSTQSQTALVVSPTHPDSCRRRIKRDLKRLWKDIFSRNLITKMPTTQPDNHNKIEISIVSVNRDRDDYPPKEDIFEQAGDMTGENAKSYIGSLDSRVRRDAVPGPNPPPKEVGVTPPDEGTLSSHSSKTMLETSHDSGPLTDVRARPKNPFKRWKTKRVLAARGMVTMSRGDE